MSLPEHPLTTQPPSLTYHVYLVVRLRGKKQRKKQTSMPFTHPLTMPMPPPTPITVLQRPPNMTPPPQYLTPLALDPIPKTQQQGQL